MSTVTDLTLHQAAAALRAGDVSARELAEACLASSAPSGTIDCLQGNLCWALTALGCEDPRLAGAYEWLARSVTGDGVAPVSDKQATVRYYAYKAGPAFACGAYHAGLPCAWGGAKVMLALAAQPVCRRTARVRHAIEQGAEFFLEHDPAAAGYPHPQNIRPSRNWWKFGFPVFYVTDVLQVVDALARLGYGNDPRLAGAIQTVVVFELRCQRRELSLSNRACRALGEHIFRHGAA